MVFCIPPFIIFVPISQYRKDVCFTMRRHKNITETVHLRPAQKVQVFNQTCFKVVP